MNDALPSADGWSGDIGRDLRITTPEYISILIGRHAIFGVLRAVGFSLHGGSRVGVGDGMQDPHSRVGPGLTVSRFQSLHT